MKEVLKDEKVLERKPTLNLKPNHYHCESDGGRWWPSKDLGQAIVDGKGWYKTKTSIDERGR